MRVVAAVHALWLCAVRLTKPPWTSRDVSLKARTFSFLNYYWEVLISLFSEGLFWLAFGWFWPVFG